MTEVYACGQTMVVIIIKNVQRPPDPTPKRHNGITVKIVSVTLPMTSFSVKINSCRRKKKQRL